MLEVTREVAKKVSTSDAGKVMIYFAAVAAFGGVLWFGAKTIASMENSLEIGIGTITN